MTDHASFLQAIRANPDDDAPRLIYADWLEEQGDAKQAEYIREAIAWAKEQALKTRPVPKPERLKISAQWHERAQEKQYRLHEYNTESAELSIIWERGFPHALLATPEDLVERGQELFDALPLTGVVLAVATPFTMQALESKEKVDTKWLQQIAGLPFLKMLRNLDAKDAYLDDNRAAILLGAPGLHQLRKLSLRGNPIGPRTLALIAKKLPHLTHLNLSRCEMLTDTDLKALDASGFAKLESLDLSDCKLTVPTLVALAQSPRLGNLREWRLKGIGLDASAMQALANSPTLENLKVLDLARTKITTPGVKALAASPHLTLEELSLDSNSLTDDAVVALADSAAMSGLRVLDLHNCRKLSDRAGQAILDSKHLRGLQTLDMKSTKLSNPCKNALRKHFGPGVCTFSR